ncbi:High mobility group like protein [Astathelohania contejeani]|uniref:High mobility group like protein n=1 Tax=Astathelohania contejeani TaxID=164912 RepID=A0ABQ7HX05_9MICR|nr:High mobility group like protein [Thelohania contejeani]
MNLREKRFNSHIKKLGQLFGITSDIFNSILTGKEINPETENIIKRKYRDPVATKNLRRDVRIKLKRMSGYIMFSKENRPKVVAETPGMPPADVMITLATLWRELPKEKKAEYSKKAKEYNKNINKE